jgi:hypothetical protein
VAGLAADLTPGKPLRRAGEFGERVSPFCSGFLREIVGRIFVEGCNFLVAALAYLAADEYRG